jgi:hypothetical protein
VGIFSFSEVMIMAIHKVGDRVRIKNINTPRDGKTGTIYNIETSPLWQMPGRVGTAYHVDIDGIGKYSPQGFNYGYLENELEPLVLPHESAWQAFKADHLIGKPELVTV